MWGALKEAFKNEFRRAPLATTFTVVGGLCAVISLLAFPIARVQFEPITGRFSISSVHLAGILSMLGFAAISASSSRFLFRIAPLPSYPVSILAAGLSILLSSAWLAEIGAGFPIRNPSGESTQNLIFWTHIFVFFSINGEQAARGVARFAPSDEGQETRDAIGNLMLIVILAVVWGRLLREAQVLLVGY